MPNSAKLRRAIRAILRRVLVGDIEIDDCVAEIEQLIDEETERCRKDLANRLRIEAMRLRP